ncbi:MAG TPA: dihydroorotate dehydrogenase [Thermoanaerobacterales bacterium]|jgi:dihydroorotate dehydrogenase (NAD+) catalytic subunit|nr:dihydroorotate dehydrogenase [Thermoanaerobacterales bacterium]
MNNDRISCKQNTHKTDLSLEIAGIAMKNPVMVASGTFGFGREYSEFIDINNLGAIVTKGLTFLPKEGNPPPRTYETPGGMLNSVGLENPGVENFIKKEMPYLNSLSIPVIVNIDGDTVNEYYKIAKRLDNVKNISALEINISCPNVKQGGMAFGQDPQNAYEVVKAVKEGTNLPIIVKLSPNVTKVEKIAEAAVSAGADAISLINTLLGMAIDIYEKKPVFYRTFAGLSGPAVKPVALRMVWQVYDAVDVPIIGMGGIFTWQDAIEFILAGASAVAVGTANFVEPQAPEKIVAGIEHYLKEQFEENIRLNDIIGLAHKANID